MTEARFIYTFTVSVSKRQTFIRVVSDLGKDRIIEICLSVQFHQQLCTSNNFSISPDFYLIFQRAKPESVERSSVSAKSSSTGIDTKKCETNRLKPKANKNFGDDFAVEVGNALHIYDQTPLVGKEGEEEKLIGKRWNADGGNEWTKTLFDF